MTAIKVLVLHFEQSSFLPGGSKTKAEFFHRRQGYGGQERLNSKAPIAEILFMEQLGEIGQRGQVFLELGSAGVSPATFGVLAERILAHRFIRRDAG